MASVPGPIRIGKTIPPAKFVSILGLGFGDCGKGLFTDYLCRHLDAHTIVRFNGGAQAGHNVVLPDGRHHTFSQFGAGTFQPGVRTVLASPVVVHPGALLEENRFLKRVGVRDALARILIDGRCRVNTPYHQAAGRLREILRGEDAHGTCGIGFGQTVRVSLHRPDLIIRFEDLSDPARTLEKMSALQSYLRTDLFRFGNLDLLHANKDALARERIDRELAILGDESVSKRWMESISEVCEKVPAAGMDAIAAAIARPGTVLFEGAQGILLDEAKGFHPHTTWSSTHASAAAEVAAEWGFTEPVFHLGVLRAYLTRHGRGPLPTRDSRLDGIAEPHNGSEGWQGAFRRGHPDGVLLKYALEAIGPLSGILLSHLDVFDRMPSGLNWCDAYDVPGMGRLEKLPPVPRGDLSAQEKLTELLARARPCYASSPVRTRDEFIERVSRTGKVPILRVSTGNTHLDVAFS
jgi:adenylosuccinate synthase